MVLQYAKAINRIDILVWHNISNNITNNPRHAQAPRGGRGRGRGCGGGRGRGSRCMNVDPSTSTQPTPSTGDGPSAAPSTNAQPPPPMSVNPSGTPSSIAQPPPPTSVSPSGTPSSIAQPTPSTSACPSDDVASSTRKRHNVAPSPPTTITHLPPSTRCHLESTPATPICPNSSPLPTSPDSAPLTTTHLPPSLRCHLESTPATPIHPSSSTLPTSLDSALAAPIYYMASFLPHSVIPIIQSSVDMFDMQAVVLGHITTHVESNSSACIFIPTPSLHTPHTGVASTDPTLTYSPPASSLPTTVDCHHSLVEVPQPDVAQDQQLEERPRRNLVRNTKCWRCGTE
jgi:hypothetical protein